MTRTAAAYCRISDDKRGEGLGVERQRQDCTDLARRRGWTLTSVYVDNDVSAYSGKPRPRYRALLEAVRAGQVQAIVAWHPDRLHRSPAELEEFITLVEAHGVLVETVQSGQVDLSTPSGRMIARSLGNFARYESEHKSERVRRALEQRAGQGKSHGRRPFGWTSGGDVLANEAAVVQEAAQRIRQGHSLRSIVADYNARGVPSPSGKPWGKTSLRHAVTRERNVSLLVRHGKVVGSGDWAPLLDRSTWEQVRAILQDPARKTSTSSAAVHLLSGLARCGLCGGPMRASMNRNTPAYKCAAKGCVARSRAEMDKLVVGLVRERLGRADAVDLVASAEGREAVQQALDEVATLRARLNRAADDWADGKLDDEQRDRISTRLQPRLEAALSRARVVDDGPLLACVTSEVGWDGLSLAQRRAVIQRLMDVHVLPARQGARVFDPSAVRITWKSGSDAVAA